MLLAVLTGALMATSEAEVTNDGGEQGEPVVLPIVPLPGAGDVPFLTVTAAARYVFADADSTTIDAALRAVSIPLKDGLKLGAAIVESELPGDRKGEKFFPLGNIDLYGIELEDRDGDDELKRVPLADLVPDPRLVAGGTAVPVSLVFDVGAILEYVGDAYVGTYGPADAPDDSEAPLLFHLLWPKSDANSKIIAASSFTYRSYYAIPFSQAANAGIGSWSDEDTTLHVTVWPMNDLMIICNYP